MKTTSRESTTMHRPTPAQAEQLAFVPTAARASQKDAVRTVLKDYRDTIVGRVAGCADCLAAADALCATSDDAMERAVLTLLDLQRSLP